MGSRVEQPGHRGVGDDLVLDAGLAQLPAGQPGAVHEGPRLGHEDAQLTAGVAQLRAVPRGRCPPARR